MPQVPSKPVIIRSVVAQERPSEDEPMTRLPTTVTDSLKIALEKQLKEMTIEESGTKIAGLFLKICF